MRLLTKCCSFSQQQCDIVLDLLSLAHIAGLMNTSMQSTDWRRTFPLDIDRSSYYIRLPKIDRCRFCPQEDDHHLLIGGARLFHADKAYGMQVEWSET